MNKTELQAALKEKGIEFDQDATNKDLEELLEQASGSEAQNQDAATSEAQAKEAQAKEAGKTKGKACKQFEVSCECPTELAFNPLKISAADEEEAKKRFFRRNGIVDTDHPVTVSEC